MDLIALMAASFLNLAVGCDALKADVLRISGQDFLVQAWSCPDKHGAPHHWRTWQRECRASNGATFWGRPYFLEDQNSGIAYYNNRFGELQGGLGAAIEQAYLPLCGS